MDKIVVLVDGGYLSKVTKSSSLDQENVGPIRLDYGRIGPVLAQKCNGELLRTYYYDCPPFLSKNPSEEERLRQAASDRFFVALKRLDNFQLRMGRLKRYYDQQGNVQFEQKGVDILIAIDALRLALKSKVTKLAIITGDSDFVPVIETIRDEGVSVFLFYHPSSVHQELLHACDSRIVLDKDTLEKMRR